MNSKDLFDGFQHNQYKHVPSRAAAGDIRRAQGTSSTPLTEFSNEGYVDAPFPLPPRRGSQDQSETSLSLPSPEAASLQRCWDLT